MDVNAAHDIIHVELWDDNLLRDTIVASGTLPLTFLLTSPAGASSGPQTITLHTSDRFRERGGRSTASTHGAGVPFGSLSVFAHLRETRAPPATDKHHGGGMTAASAGSTAPRSIATTGAPMTTAGVGDADALGRRGAPPTALSSGTTGIAGEVWDVSARVCDRSLACAIGASPPPLPVFRARMRSSTSSRRSWTTRPSRASTR